MQWQKDVVILSLWKRAKTKEKHPKNSSFLILVLRFNSFFRKMATNYFEITIAKDSLLQEEMLDQLEQWIIPDRLVGFEVIKPDVYSIDDISFEWEDLQRTRWVMKLQAHRYQKSFHQGEKSYYRNRRYRHRPWSPRSQRDDQ